MEKGEDQIKLEDFLETTRNKLIPVDSIVYKYLQTKIWKGGTRKTQTTISV